MLTTKDWIARADEDPATFAESLAQAETAVHRPDESLAVAEAWLARGRTHDARRCIESALDSAAGDHWPTRNAATLLLAELSDPEGAIAALARIGARLRTDERVRTYRWVMLGQAYRDILGDDEEARRCIEHATATAVSADDLADLAEGHVELFGDPATAREVLERAEQAARSDLREMWGIANRWMHTFHDPARARQALEIATFEGTDVRDLTAFATAWRSLFDDEVQIRATLTRAESLATTATQWLKIAEAYFDGGTDNRGSAWDPEGVRRALETSLATEPSAEERALITTGYRDWLGLSAESLGLPPAMQEPEAVAIRARTVAGWQGEARALLHALRARLTPERLEPIATSDYGMAWVKHHRVLVEIHATGLIPIPLQWHPQEALELYRWDRGASTDHLARAFACTILALEAVAPTSGQNGHIGDALAPMIESAWAEELAQPLESTLVWLAEVTPREDAAWSLFGLLLCAARRDPADPRLESLVSDLLAAEAESTGTWSDAWLFRTTNFDTYHDLWRELAAATLEGAAVPHLASVARLLTSVVTRR